MRKTPTAIIIKLMKTTDKNTTEKYVSLGIDDTLALAHSVADTLTGGEILLLDGDLGAGKTTFTKGLAKALGIKAEITSPTFTIMNQYEGGRLKLNHLDMYRIDDEAEVAELGLDEAFSDDSVTVIEWNKYKNLSGKIIRIGIANGNGENERIFVLSL